MHSLFDDTGTGPFQLHLREVQEEARVVGRGDLWEGGHQYISNFTGGDTF